MVQFTPEQRAALDLHVHCAVHANAGSGKTSVVSHRFVKILIETGTPLDQIIAITFTRAAAAEMRERIHRLLLEAQESPELRATFSSSLTDEQLCGQLRQWAIDIANARISTFHSFCAGLIQQYAEELELDADMQELDPTDASSMIDEAVRRTLAEELAPSSSSSASLQSVFDDISVAVLQDLLVSATQESSFFASIARSAEQITSQTRRELTRLITQRITQDALLAYVDTLRPLDDVPEIRSRIENAQALIERCADVDDTRVVAEYLELFSSTFTLKGTVKVNVIPKSVRELLDTLPSAPATLIASTNVLKIPWDDLRERRFDDIVNALYHLATQSRQRYRVSKRERNAIDFDDMIHLALELLQHDEIVQALRSRVRYIMVDEFQDTDPLQYDVLSRIAPALRGDDAPTPNVYIVGDDKQSIYGFRDADVRLFRKATYALQCSNLHRGADTGYRPLMTSFRMHERLAHSVNAICSAMFGSVPTPPITDTTSFDVGYQPLQSVPATITSDELGTCSVLTTERDEATAIADVVASILNGHLRRDVAEYDRHRGEWTLRKPRPSDVTILLQTNAQIISVGQALSRNGIPADLAGGASFFARPEIADLRALLTTCISPTDNLAVAALCRSPLLRCTDGEIATAALLGRRSSLRDGLAQVVSRGTATPNLINAHERILAWEQASIRMSPVELVQFALDTSGWYATLAQEDRREQIRANVEKAFEIIRSAVDGTGGTLYDAVTALRPSDNDRERDGFVPTNGDAVRVMTIHASKGLEFGIVVIGGLNAKPAPTKVTTSDQLGVTFSLATTAIDEHAPEKLVDLAELQSHAIAKFLIAQRELAEYRRRLYVALTRAKMHVVISHCADELHGNLHGMAGILGQALLDAQQHISRVLDKQSEPYEAPTLDREDLVLLDVIPTPLPDLIAPTSFLDTHRWDDGDDRVGTGDTAGAAYGIALHDVLGTTLPELLKSDATHRIARIAQALAAHQLDRTRAAEAVLEITSLLDTPLVAEHHDLLCASRREVRLVGALDDVVLQGILDCRITHDDTSISIWDWKTNVVRDIGDLDALAHVYYRQMQTYAWLCFQSYPECPAVTTRLIFTKAIVQGLPSFERSFTWKRSDVADLEDALRAALAELHSRGNS